MEKLKLGGLCSVEFVKFLVLLVVNIFRLNLLPVLLQIGILSAGTNVGTIVMWRFLVGDTSGGDGLQAGRSGFPASTDPAQNWLRELPCNVRGAVKHLTWSQSHPLLAVNIITAVFVLREQELCAHYGELVSVTFSSSMSVCYCTGFL